VEYQLASGVDESLANNQVHMEKIFAKT